MRPPAHAPEFSRVFAARTCMMAGVGLTGVFLWYLVRFWVYGKAVVLTSAPLTIPAGFLIAGMAVATLIGAALASWAAGPISERIEEKNIPWPVWWPVPAAVCRWFGARMGPWRLVHRHCP